MLLIQMLLPRFLILEGVFFFHFVMQGQSCMSKIDRKINNLISSVGGSNASSAETPRNVAQSPKCIVDLDEIRLKYVPLFTSPATGAFLLPQPRVAGSPRKGRWLTLEEPSVNVACPGAKIKSVASRSAHFKCLEDDIFQLEPLRNVSFGEFSCSRSIREKVIKSEAKCGPRDAAGKMAEIGWEIDQDDGGTRFESQISVCHDSDLGVTYFTNHSLYGASIEAKETESRRPSYFKEGGFFKDISADRVYKVKTQKSTLNSIFGEVEAGKIFNLRTSFLAKGHLSPDADFIYKEWQDATYYFINVAPQWQAFNNGNWKAFEEAVRNYAEKTGDTLNVITGTLGEMRHNGLKVSLSGRLVPVPEFYWKIVHDIVNDEAIVFVGLNNPHFNGDPQTEAQICPDICAAHKWFFLHKDNVQKGFSYCCSYQDFKGAIDWAPDIGDPDILDNILV